MDATPLNFLLIEDEPADAHLFRIALRDGKVPGSLHHAVDGLDALAYLGEEGKQSKNPRPDLILLDLNMPRMNGREFLAAIKSQKELSSIPVVVLTSSDVERDVLASYQLGAAGYITKPAEMDRFVATILGLESYWRSVVRLPSSH